MSFSDYIKEVRAMYVQAAVQSGLSPLCDVCQNLDLWKTENRPDFKYSLGPWKEIERKATVSGPRCPFCVFMYPIIMREYNLEQNPTVYIEWKKEGGFFMFTRGRNISFLTGHTPGSPYGFARTVEPSIDPGLVKKWITLCETQHGGSCTPRRGIIRTSEEGVGVKVLRLVDTETNCIVEASGDPRYLALSYVWGPGLPAIRLTKNTVKDLSGKGAFDRHRDIIPKTIRDAIDLVHMIGERYLWVDSLCLIQDDEADMLDGINHMDLVYQCALATIIASHGEHCNAGLPGVHPGSRTVSQNITEVLPGISMTETEGVYDSMKGVYRTRGWTHQELVLSHRALIFTENRIHFRCRANSWCEDTIYDQFPLAVNEVLHSGGGIEFMDDNENSPLSSYVKQLFLYVGRNLTKESDTIHGFTGILRFLSGRCKTGIIEGMFTAAFDVCILCWNNFPRGVNDVGRRAGFPSWSWAGHRGMRDGYGRKCTDPASVNQWLQKQTYIVWYVRSPETYALDLVWDLESQAKYGIPEASDITYRPTAEDPYGRCASEIQAHGNQTKPRIGNSQRDLIIRAELDKRKYHFIHFFAYTVRAYGFGPPPQSSDWAMVHPLLDPQRRQIGSIKFDIQTKPEMKKNKHELVMLSKMDQYDDFFNDTITFERPFYWVMLIEWVGTKKVLAERRGIGLIFQDCMEYVLSPGKVWKEIVLA
ncbi:hypothetical protein JR316_0004155 [Psilocybe cubensis]|uniref:Uncharacterized protein n=2 Tax=Psilocybe cubensis TaxID=181762 RepID=A0ACB8H4E5_PSICU|nr:hypothetical protein JR316_0004155 [Psilocybe cubensis]KAH9482060.1 hypothetical protein JR316_0004155 [Psilocybe cubensis]